MGEYNKLPLELLAESLKEVDDWPPNNKKLQKNPRKGKEIIVY